jgi:hypothetical protein
MTSRSAPREGESFKQRDEPLAMTILDALFASEESLDPVGEHAGL